MYRLIQNEQHFFITMFDIGTMAKKMLTEIVGLY